MQRFVIPHGNKKRQKNNDNYLMTSLITSKKKKADLPPSGDYKQYLYSEPKHRKHVRLCSVISAYVCVSILFRSDNSYKALAVVIRV